MTPPPGHDALNRPLRKNYTSAVATPSVVYSYDQDLSGGVRTIAGGG
ncbi:MAG: hypothetical protein IPP47_00280 [Bryobacterales bacterium]|nr:hypothetical protein [Bryobacterales bacterium]